MVRVVKDNKQPRTDAVTDELSVELEKLGIPTSISVNGLNIEVEYDDDTLTNTQKTQLNTRLTNLGLSDKVDVADPRGSS